MCCSLMPENIDDQLIYSKTKVIMKTIIPLLLLVFFTFDSCQKKNDTNTHQDLILTKWLFLGIENTDSNTKEFVPDNLSEMYVIFDKYNKLHTVSSCNYFDANYITDGKSELRIDSLITTYKACVNNTFTSWEKIYFNGFYGATSYYFSGDTLFIQTNSRINMIFRPMFLIK